MRKHGFILVLALLLVLVMPIFAEGTIEEAREAGKAEAAAEMQAQVDAAYEAGKAYKAYSNIGSMAGVTRPTVSGRMVVHAGSPAAVMAGYNVLMNGGNAFDAAAAVAVAQGYSEQLMTNALGGDAFIILYDAKEGKVKVYNGTGFPGENQTIDYYLDNVGSIPSNGILSSHIPGEWGGWMLLLNDYGTKSLEEILAPTIDLAENGLALDEFSGMMFGMATPRNDEAKSVWMPDGENKLKTGDVMYNKDYANTLKRLVEASKQGATIQEGYKLANDYYYNGPLAEEIVAWNNANGGVWTVEDFAHYQAFIQEPITTNYKGYDIYACPPNSQGTTYIEALNILKNFDLQALGHNTAKYVNVLAQALNIALNDRNSYSGDPNFVDWPEEMLTDEYAAKMAKYINVDGVMTELPDGGLEWTPYEGQNTTFMAVADKEGNFVAVTHSVNGVGGSGLMVDGLGILLNNRMTYYSLDETHPNYLAPYKRTLQTITPAIALKDGQPAFFVGTPGSDNQEQTKLQVTLNYIEWGLSPQNCVEKPRFVSNHPASAGGSGVKKAGALSVMTFGTDIINELTEMGYTVSSTTNTGSLGFGCYEDGIWRVGADPTRDAYSFGSY